jgi:hypothetical protein
VENAGACARRKPWSMNTDTMGVYGNYYLKRAIIAQSALGANVPEDAIYPVNLGDQAGRPLDGANKYALHFDKGALPPSCRSSSYQKTSERSCHHAEENDNRLHHAARGRDSAWRAGDPDPR